MPIMTGKRKSTYRIDEYLSFLLDLLFHKALLFPHIYLTNNDYPQLSQERDAFPLSGPPK